MPFKTLNLDLSGAVGELRQLGVDGAAHDELERAMAAAGDAPKLRCLLLTSEHASWPSIEPTGQREHNALPFRSIELLRVPVIAVIEGACIDGALELALACDIRVGSESATFAMSQVSAGGMPSLGGTQRLPRIAGRTLATEMILLQRELTAAEAHGCGLLNLVTAPGEAASAARRLAERIAERGPLAVGYAKEAVLRGLDLPLDAALRYETDLTVILQTTADRNEGVRAFTEKRDPKFKGD